MPAQYTCSKCGRSSRLPDGFRGNQIKCLACSTLIPVDSTVSDRVEHVDPESRPAGPGPAGSQKPHRQAEPAEREAGACAMDCPCG